jgi:hypothetical protein
MSFLLCVDVITAEAGASGRDLSSRTLSDRLCARCTGQDIARVERLRSEKRTESLTTHTKKSSKFVYTSRNRKKEKERKK